MNAAELYFEDGKPASVFYCTKCKAVHKTFEFADACCVCSSCKKPMPERRFTCEECSNSQYRKRRQAMHEKATKVAQEDYKGAMVYLDDENEYVSTDDLADRLFYMLEDHLELGGAKEDWEPPNVFGTIRVEPRFDLERMIESELEQSYDDAMDDVTATAKDREELQDLLDAWADKHLPVSYDADYTVALIIDTPEEPTHDESPEDGCEAEVAEQLKENLQP